MRTIPMLVSFLSIIVNFGLNWVLTYELGLGVRGLALSTGLVALCNFGLLYGILWKRLGGMEGKAMAVTLSKLALGGAALAVVCWGGHHYLLDPLATHGFLLRALALGAVIGVGAALYFTVTIACGVEELANFTKIVRRKIAR